jgi:hypothetical protein
MDRDLRTLLAEAQFLLAQALWDPRRDRRRALRIARIASKTSPDPRVRAEIGRWLRGRVPPPSALEDVAIEYLREELRADSDGL